MVRDTFVISLQATYIKTDLHNTESCRDVRASMQRDKVTYSACVLCAISHLEEKGTAADMAIGHVSARGRVGNFRQKNNSAEDGIDGTKGDFRRNSGCSAEQKPLGIPFRILPRKR